MFLQQDRKTRLHTPLSIFGRLKPNKRPRHGPPSPRSSCSHGAPTRPRPRRGSRSAPSTASASTRSRSSPPTCRTRPSQTSSASRASGAVVDSPTARTRTRRGSSWSSSSWRTAHRPTGCGPRWQRRTAPFRRWAFRLHAELGLNFAFAARRGRPWQGQVPRQAAGDGERRSARRRPPPSHATRTCCRAACGWARLTVACRRSSSRTSPRPTCASYASRRRGGRGGSSRSALFNAVLGGLRGVVDREVARRARRHV